MSQTKPKKNKGPGKPTLYSKKLGLQIRRLYLSGLDNNQIREELDIKKSTWDKWYWNDTGAFRTSFTLWRREKMLHQAEKNLEGFLDMPTEIQDIEDSDDEQGSRAVVVTDPRLVKIKLDATTYATDTLGKDTYSKKVLQEDPNGVKHTEVDELRQQLKGLLTTQRKKYTVRSVDKLKLAIGK